MYERHTTIGIATHNGLPFVRQAIESALATGARVAISDDGSTDGTRDVLDAYSDRADITMHPANRGIAANYQFLLEHCETPLVHLLNQDDALLPEVLRETDPSVEEVAVFNGWVIDETGRRLRTIYRRPPWQATTKGLFRGLTVANFTMSLSQALLPVAPSLESGGFAVPDDPGQGAEDHMLFLRLAAAGVRTRLWLRRATLYRRHSKSFSSSSASHRESMAAVRRAIPPAPSRDPRLRLRW